MLTQSAEAAQIYQDQVKKLADLQSTFARLRVSSDINETQVQMVRGACTVLGSEAGVLILVDETRQYWLVRKLVVQAVSGEFEWVYQVNLQFGPADLSKGLIRECLFRRQAIRVNDVTSDPRFEASIDSPAGMQVRSLLCAPLLLGDRLVGAIQVLNNQRGFNDFDQSLLGTIALLIARAIDQTQQIQDLKISNADLEASRWELLSSHYLLTTLLDNLPANIYAIDREYRLLAVNRMRAQVTGQSSEELAGQTCYQAFFNRRSACPDCKVQETLQKGIQTQRFERRLGKADETTEWEINSYPVNAGQAAETPARMAQAVLFEQDITEKRHLESILTQSEKLAAVGQLAAGVAHEINNPLTAIIANAQILHRELPPNHDLQESVDLIARAGARAAQVVRNLLDFARKEDYHLGITDVNETIERALELIQHEVIARGVELNFEPDPNLPSILASQDHLQSVWLNLLLNAIDSLDKTPGEVRVWSRRTGDSIEIAVSDNGKGIPPDRLTRIFEPFYTTKAPGRGTGLGLSVSHRIIKQHGGHIRVESQVGVGSTFTVILPVL
jgi:two-component system NtrC family sensor kinase